MAAKSTFWVFLLVFVFLAFHVFASGVRTNPMLFKWQHSESFGWNELCYAASHKFRESCRGMAQGIDLCMAKVVRGLLRELLRECPRVPRVAPRLTFWHQESFWCVAPRKFIALLTSTYLSLSLSIAPSLPLCLCLLLTILSLSLSISFSFLSLSLYLRSPFLLNCLLQFISQIARTSSWTTTREDKELGKTNPTTKCHRNWANSKTRIQRQNHAKDDHHQYNQQSDTHNSSQTPLQQAIFLSTASTRHVHRTHKIGRPQMWERVQVGFGSTGKKRKGPCTKQCAWRKHGSCDTRLAEACPPKLWNTVKYRVEKMRPNGHFGSTVRPKCAW